MASNVIDNLVPGERAEDPRSVIWSLGDYATVARDVVGGLGPVLVDACGIERGQKVLDVAAGSGSSAIPAAQRGAHVTALDLTPKLLEAGRAEASQRGLEIEWVEGDAQSLPFEDGEFDVVISCIGAMFAPDHDTTATEIARVCRSGGTIGMINWPPDGSVAEFFKTFSAYAPPPPEDFRPPTLWGDAEYVQQLFGDEVSGWEASRGHLVVDHFETAQQWCDYYKRNFGPTIATYAAIAHDGDLTAQLDRDFLTFSTEQNLSTEPDRTIYHLEYLLLTGRKSAG